MSAIANNIEIIYFTWQQLLVKLDKWLRKIYLRQILVYRTFGIGPWSGNLPYYFWPLLKDLGFVVSFYLY